MGRSKVARMVAIWRQMAREHRDIVAGLPQDDELRLSEESLADFLDRQCAAVEAGWLSYAEFRDRIAKMMQACEEAERAGAVVVIVPADTH